MWMEWWVDGGAILGKCMLGSQGIGFRVSGAEGSPFGGLKLNKR